MDNQIRNNAPGRIAATNDTGHDPTASRDLPDAGTAPATRPAQTSTLENEIVTICAWCPELHILNLQRRDVDVIVTFQLGKDRKTLKIMRNGKDLRISDGICQPCREKLHRKAAP